MKTEIKGLFLVAMLAPTFAMADYFKGPYVGANVGGIQSYEKLHHDMDLVFPVGSPTLIDISNFNSRPTYLSNISVQGGLNVGFNFIISPYLLVGAEVRGNLQNIQMNHDQFVDVSVINAQAEFHSRLKMDQSYGLLGKIGWKLTPESQIYGLFGVQWGRFQYHGTGHVYALPNGSAGAVAMADFDEQDSANKRGFVLGLGTEIAVSNHSTVGLEYTYDYYGTVHVPRFQQSAIVGANAPAGSNIHVFNHVKVLTNNVMLRYNYYFCGY